MGLVEDQATNVVDRLEELGVPSRIVRIVEGPTVVRCELVPADSRIKMHDYRKLSRADDLAMAVGARAVSISAPLPGRDVVGVEWERPDRQAVSLGELPTATAPLTAPVGLDAAGEPVELDLAAAPHVLIAGQTGSGKTTALHGILCSLVSALSPTELSLVLVDPKRTEMAPYRGLPHVATVADDVDAAVRALRGLVALMEDRYRLMQSLGVRDLTGANDALEKMGSEPVCRVVLACDELADLMMASGKGIEPLLVKLAQKGRAAGVHLVLATQYPKAEVLPGLLRANLPTKLAFALPDQVASRLVLGVNGAERLLGRGDGLLSVCGAAPVRVQAPFVSPNEVNKIVALTSNSLRKTATA